MHGRCRLHDFVYKRRAGIGGRLKVYAYNYDYMYICRLDMKVTTRLRDSITYIRNAGDNLQFADQLHQKAKKPAFR